MNRVLFFSRGRGRGHAVPDLALCAEMERLSPDTSITFASYGRGLKVLRDAGRNAIDLALPEGNDLFPTMLSCHATISEVRPDIVVSHEEFCVHPVGAMLKLPSIFLSAWLPAPKSPQAEAIGHASSIIVLDSPGKFPLAPDYRGRVSYVGPVIRKTSCRAEDRSQVRPHLGLAPDDKVIAVIPGGWREEDAPIADSVLEAFALLPFQRKVLIWQSAEDFIKIAERVRDRPGIRVIRYAENIDQLIAACDVVVTKGTYGISMEAAAIGVPTIALTHYQNVVDNILLSNEKTNVTLNAMAVDGPILAAYMTEAMNATGWRWDRERFEVGRIFAAQTLLGEISRLLAR